MKPRSAVQCCVRTGLSQEVRQPRELTSIDFANRTLWQQQWRGGMWHHCGCLACQKTYHGGPDQYQLVQVNLAFLPPFTLFKSENQSQKTEQVPCFLQGFERFKSRKSLYFFVKKTFAVQRNVAVIVNLVHMYVAKVIVR